jgi:hypothetical protein
LLPVLVLESFLHVFELYTLVSRWYVDTFENDWVAKLNQRHDNSRFAQFCRGRRGLEGTKYFSEELFLITNRPISHPYQHLAGYGKLVEVKIHPGEKCLIR